MSSCILLKVREHTTWDHLETLVDDNYVSVLILLYGKDNGRELQGEVERMFV